MHEAATMQTVVKTILATTEQMRALRVIGVELELGASDHFTEEAVRQYFLALTRNTPLENATLTLSWRPATYQCLSCQQRFQSSSSTETCPRCGDLALEISHEDGCYIRTIEMIPSDEYDRKHASSAHAQQMGGDGA